MIATISQACRRPWMALYLRIVAVVYALGALVHYANLLGFGELPWGEMPLSWKIGDVAYASLDTATAAGLWLRAAWGVVCLLLAALSQLVLYGGFPQLFALTPEHHQALQGLITIHVITLAVFLALFFAKK